MMRDAPVDKRPDMLIMSARMYVCVCMFSVYTYMCMHAYMFTYVYICKHICACMHTCLHTCIYVLSMHTHVHARTHARTYTHTCPHVPGTHVIGFMPCKLSLRTHAYEGGSL